MMFKFLTREQGAFNRIGAHTTTDENRGTTHGGSITSDTYFVISTSKSLLTGSSVSSDIPYFILWTFLSSLLRVRISAPTVL